MTRSHRAIEGLGAQYLSFAVKAGIKLLVTPFYLARLGPELMGFNYFINESLAYFQLMDFGIGTGLTALVAKDSQPDATAESKEALFRKLRAGGQIQLILALTALVLSLILAFFIMDLARGLPLEYLRMAQICTVLFGLGISMYLASGVYKAILVGRQRIAENTFYSVVAAIVGAIAGVSLVAAGWSLFGVALAAVASALIFFFQSRLRTHRLGIRLNLAKPPLESKAMPELAGLGGWIFLATIGGLLSLNSASIILGLIPSKGMAAVNLYALLMAVPAILRLQANRVAVIVRPGLTQLQHSGREGERAASVCRLMMKVMGLLGATAFIGIRLINGPFVIRWVGEEYYAGDAANLLAACLIGLTIWLFGFKVLMEVRFDYRKRGVAFFTSGIVTLAISLLIAPRLGVEGVLIAAIAAEGLAACIWFIPSGMKMLDIGRNKTAAVSIIWVPLLLVIGSYMITPFIRPVPTSWQGIITGSAAVAAICALAGAAWLGRDAKGYLLGWIRSRAPH